MLRLSLKMVGTKGTEEVRSILLGGMKNCRAAGIKVSNNFQSHPKQGWLILSYLPTGKSSDQER